VHEVVLVRHPQSAGGTSLDVRARWHRQAGTLNVTYVVEGERVRVPEPAAPRFAHDLWKHTCFEAFFAPRGASAYHEFNLSPSGEWAAYAFASYRKRVAFDAEGLDPDIEVRRSGATLQLDASISLERLSPADQTLSMGLSAVIEEVDGALSYWALRHAAGKPDFHHPDAFAAVLE